MAIEIGELRGILSLQDKFSGPADKAAKQLGVMGKSFGTLTKVAGVAAAAIGGATATIIALGARGAVVDDVRSAFSSLSEAAGGTADVMLGALRRGVKGTLSDFELMKLANKTLGSELVSSADDFEVLAEGARALAKRTGGDTKVAFETLTQAIASGRTTQLRQLGLFVDSKKATEQFASSHGKTISTLTDADRAQALAGATLAELREMLERTAPPAADFGERIEQAKVQLVNFTDSLAVAVSTSPVVAAGLEAMSKAMTAAFGGDQQAQVKALMGYVNNFAIFLADVAKIGISSAKFITNAFHGVRVIFNAVLEALFTGLAKANELIATLAEKAASLPVVGQGFEAIAEGARKVADMNASIAFGMGDLKEKALDAAAATSAGFDEMSTAITNVQNAMIAAKDTQVEATAAVAEFGTATGEAAWRLEDSTEKIAAAYRKLDEEIALIGRVGLDRRMIELAFRREEELASLAQLSELTQAEYTELVLKVEEKYKQMTAAAQLSKDEIVETTRKLQEELALASTTGLEESLLRIEFQRETEIAGLIHLREVYGEEYTTILALVNEKYDQMASAATGYHDDIVKQAADAGFTTRKELEKTAKLAVDTYKRMLASGEFTARQLQEAFEAGERAKRDAASETLDFQMSAHDAYATGTTQILGVLGEKHKAFAIAGAIISTYQAVAKALASAPWPANLVLAAGALAVGLANVARIRSSKPGFAEGTPEASFLDFGRGSLEMLHGDEAVVTRAQGENLADMLTDAVVGGKAGQTIRVPIYVDGRMLTEGIVKHIPAVLALNGVRG